MDAGQPDLKGLWAGFTGYQRCAALKAGIELEVFTHIASGATTIDALADKCKAAPRGLRALLNRLVVDELLTKDGETYGLTMTSTAFLDRNSPGYVGSVATFILSPMIVESFSRLTEAVRLGGTAMADQGTLEPEHPVWVEFARAMAPLARMSGMLVASLLEVGKLPGGKALDIAAGHGMFGIELALANPKLEVSALDWGNVLKVAQENARAVGVADRYHLLPGSAFDVPWGEGSDLVLLPNFLHHFDIPTCEQILTKAREALAPNGRVVIVEFIPDEGRVTPPDAASFALVMLASTPSGDAYTFAEYQQMLSKVGLSQASLHTLEPTPTRVIIAQR